MAIAHHKELATASYYGSRQMRFIILIFPLMALVACVSGPKPAPQERDYTPYYSEEKINETTYRIFVRGSDPRHTSKVLFGKIIINAALLAKRNGYDFFDVVRIYRRESYEDSSRDSLDSQSLKAIIKLSEMPKDKRSLSADKFILAMTLDQLNIEREAKNELAY